jgi:hypothetical protein
MLIEELRVAIPPMLLQPNNLLIAAQATTVIRS